ncbi:O-linked N-acetylglucosamine transferase, SPINDLY family [Candidatus Magnetomorum sp. HK-1]|nr:O-linked N-acetylglucosamine transferase, SPINDLY family [Candidatus Magnetomorum sp. HK-1]
MSSTAKLLKKAIAYQKAGDQISAESVYRVILSRYPDNVDAANLLACLLMDRGDFLNSEKLIQQAIDQRPDIYFFHYHLGLVYSKQCIWDKAISAFQTALKYHPDHVDSLNNLGVALKNKGQYESAITSFKQALKIDSKHSASHNNLAGIYLITDSIKKALTHFKKAIKYRPEIPEYHKNIAGAYRKLHQLKQAENHLKLALKFDPGYIKALNDYGVILKDQGKNRRAYKVFCQLVDQQENFIEAHSNRLYLLHYLHEKSPEFIFQEHLNFGKKLLGHKNNLNKIKKNPNEKRIRVGYVSPDFRNHSVSLFFESVLRNHNPEHFDVFCYSNVSKPDNVTTSLQSLNVNWRNIYGLSDELVCKQIENDCIDILVDLAGHSANNRLMIFAHKPAPVQVTYLGYPNTTGLSTVDYRITDMISDPPGTDKLYIEKLIYIEPCFLCYLPPKETHKNILKEKNSTLTFGSFNNIGKLNDTLLSTWSSILKKMPDSKLILKSGGFTGTDIKSYWRDKFIKHGVSDHQLEFLGYIPDSDDHLSAYHSIDIALDTFPYNGTATTFEALWMGTPVITLAGNSHVSRVGCSILKALGLKDLIARSQEEYISKAIGLAKDAILLKDLNGILRNLLKQSILTDGKYFTNQLEKQYQKILKEKF